MSRPRSHSSVLVFAVRAAPRRLAARGILAGRAWQHPSFSRSSLLSWRLLHSLQPPARRPNLLGPHDYDMCALTHKVGWATIGAAVGFAIRSSDSNAVRGTGGNQTDRGFCTLWGKQPPDASFPPQLNLDHHATPGPDGYTPAQIYGFCHGPSLTIAAPAEGRVWPDGSDIRVCFFWQGAETFIELSNTGKSAAANKASLVRLYRLLARRVG